MKRIGRILIVLVLLFLSACEKEKEYVYFNFGCGNTEYYKCELKNNKLNCNVETPSCGEYKFIGWFRANEYNNPVDLSSGFTENEIIYARWEKGNGIIEPSSQEESTSTIIPPGTIDIPSSSKEEPSSSEIPVTPPTPEETYTISFNSNGGTGGQTGKVNVKYNQTLPSISSTKPTKPGYTFMGWYDKTTGGTQYYNSSNSGVRKYDKKSNITLYAQWKINVLSIQYNGNGGVWNSTNPAYGVNSSGLVIVKSTGKVYQQQLNYGTKLESSGLTDCNGSWFKWEKDKSTVESKKEYYLQNGSTTTYLDQTKVYSAIELSRYAGCDLSKTNCTITVKVNWVENFLASSGLGRNIIPSKELKTACYWVINQELVNIRLQTCTGQYRYQNPNAELPGGSRVISNGESDLAKETIPFSEYTKGVFFGEIPVEGDPDYRYTFTIMYRTVFLKNTVHYAIAAKRDPVIAREEIRFRAGSCNQNYRNSIRKKLYDSGDFKEEIDDARNTTKYLILANSNGEITNTTYHSDGVAKANCERLNRSCNGIYSQIKNAAAQGKSYIEILETVVHKNNYEASNYRNAHIYDCRNLIESGDIKYEIK